MFSLSLLCMVISVISTFCLLCCFTWVLISLKELRKNLISACWTKITPKSQNVYFQNFNLLNHACSAVYVVRSTLANLHLQAGDMKFVNSTRILHPSIYNKNTKVVKSNKIDYSQVIIANANKLPRILTSPTMRHSINFRLPILLLHRNTAA
jgi:hypothetical protein